MKLLDDVLFPKFNDWMLGEATTTLRAQVAGGARGRVLEIGAGTGLNFRHYAPEVEVVAIEPGSGMRKRAEQRVAAGFAQAPIRVEYGNVLRLPYDAGSFDTVVATFVLCSVEDLDQALTEIGRVLRPGGTFRVVEHVKSPDPSIYRWQKRLRPVWMSLLGGCDPTRDVRAALQSAGFDVENLGEVSLPLPSLAKAGVCGVAAKT